MASDSENIRKIWESFNDIKSESKEVLKENEFSGALDFRGHNEMDETFAGRTTPTFGRKGASMTGPNPMFDGPVESFENYIIMNGAQNRDAGVQFAAREHGIDPTDLKMELIKRKAYDMQVPSRELRDSVDQELKSFKEHLAEVLAKGKK